MRHVVAAEQRRVLLRSWCVRAGCVRACDTVCMRRRWCVGRCAHTWVLCPLLCVASAGLYTLATVRGAPLLANYTFNRTVPSGGAPQIHMNLWQVCATRPMYA